MVLSRVLRIPLLRQAEGIPVSIRAFTQSTELIYLVRVGLDASGLRHQYLHCLIQLSLRNALM